MQKAKRFIGSRYFVAGLCLLLELLQIVAIYLTLYRFFLPLTILAWVTNFAVLVYLISRDDIPEFKILWFATLSTLPILGAFLFILLSGNTAGKRAFRRYECARSEIQQLLPDTGMERISDRTAFSIEQTLFAHPRSHNTLGYPVKKVSRQGFDRTLCADWVQCHRHIHREIKLAVKLL